MVAVSNNQILQHGWKVTCTSSGACFLMEKIQIMLDFELGNC